MNAEEKGVISAFQNVLTSWKFTKSGSFDEDFAQRRFQKKFERPDPERRIQRANACWTEYLTTDGNLPTTLPLLSVEWIKAKAHLTRWLSNLKLSDIHLPKRSSFEPTLGKNSVYHWLSEHAWTCSPDCFPLFRDAVLRNKALKRSLRVRWHSYLSSKGWPIMSSEKELWNHFKDSKDPVKDILTFKLEKVTKFVYFSRFSTVPKNNSVDRPINLEPFGNMVVQRSIGTALRSVLAREGLDLDHTADVHRIRISDSTVATIDLKNASDSISLALCRSILPKNFMSLLEKARSEFLLGPDGLAYPMKKISSMGNGFTFELMTMILYALCQTLDDKSSVFGDDIIIIKTVAPQIIRLLNEVGFVVNVEKSFIDGPFRESCGANYHDDSGYVKSFDFHWPATIHDCCTLFNKVSILADGYPSFESLRRSLITRIPSALHGSRPAPLKKGTLFIKYDERVEHSKVPTYPDISGWFHCIRDDGSRRVRKRGKGTLVIKDYQTVVYGRHIGFRSLERVHVRSASHVDDLMLYEFYLFSGRVLNVEISGFTKWRRCFYYLLHGESTRASLLKPKGSRR
jgi:hypothetical protein